MIQLSTFLWSMVAFFAAIGFLRGWTKEVAATAGIILALFISFQFSPLVIQPLTQGASGSEIFWLYTLILVIVAFFGYQTPMAASRATEGRYWGGRPRIQERVLGTLVGAFNGYLLFGSIWYYMDVTQYPLAPYITSPAPGSASAALVNTLPLVFLAQGNLLTVLVIVLFLFVIIAVI